MQRFLFTMKYAEIQITMLNETRDAAKAMTANRTCAIVITYHPQASLFEHFATLRSQAQGLVVVDNGSTPDELEKLKSETSTIDFHLIENGENRGVAAALNTGIRWAIENRYEWVALLTRIALYRKAI